MSDNDRERIGIFEPATKVVTRLGAGALSLAAVATLTTEQTPRISETAGYGVGGALIVSGLLWLPEAISRYRSSHIE